jgi:hypothetical protein
LKVGTHCADRPDGELTAKYGRWPNEKAVHREAFIYRLLDAMQVPTLKARSARITYVTPGRGERLTRNALFLEDEQEAIGRLGGRKQIPPDEFSSAREAFRVSDTAKLAFANAMIGNFDWCLRMYPDDTFRCNDTNPLWNVMAVVRPGSRPLPVMQDFDLAGMVTGRHVWFNDVFSRRFSSSEADVEVVAQVQRTRTLFPRAELDAARAAFGAQKSVAYDTLARSALDDQGQSFARQYLDSFFAAIESHEAFYRPVVVANDAVIYADAARSRPMCRTGRVQPGTPVGPPLEQSGGMARVLVLDALWQFPRSCAEVRTGPVWIQTSAIGTDFPAIQ